MQSYRYGTIFVRKITKDHSEKDIQQALNDVSSVTFCPLAEAVGSLSNHDGNDTERHVKSEFAFF